MNNEIKEIRDILFEFQFLGNDTQSKVVKLHDYITNLQQENERANQYIDFYKDLVNKQSKRNSRQRLANQKQQELILKLQQENERLKEQANDNKVIIEYAIKPSFTTRKLQDYKSRIDKASEYINKFWKEKSYYESVENCLKFATMNEFEKEDLLNVLQNGCEENVSDRD